MADDGDVGAMGGGARKMIPQRSRRSEVSITARYLRRSLTDTQHDSGATRVLAATDGGGAYAGAVVGRDAGRSRRPSAPRNLDREAGRPVVALVSAAAMRSVSASAAGEMRANSVIVWLPVSHQTPRTGTHEERDERHG